MKDENNIVFKNEKNEKFTFRVSAIIMNNEKMLLQKGVDRDYYFLVGGRVEFSESTEDALIREIEEETGIKTSKRNIKLIDVVENFYHFNSESIHELLFVYKVMNIDEFLPKGDFTVLDNDLIMNKWINLKEIDNIIIQPSNIKNILNVNELIHEVVKDSIE